MEKKVKMKEANRWKKYGKSRIEVSAQFDEPAVCNCKLSSSGD